jgi:tRNA (mo5U34)-methyltransferase
MTAYSQDEIRSRVGALGPWFHNLDLGGVRTAPDHFLHDYPNVKWRASPMRCPRT